MTQPGDIADILMDQERLLMVAWMLPNDGPLTDKIRRQAMGNFAAYIRRHSMTASDVGRQIGKPRATTIGDLMKGRYRDGADGHIRTLNMFIEQHARANAASLTDRFVSTRVAKDIFTVARLTRENKTMGLVTGGTGIGKSRCAQALHEKYVGSIYIRVVTGYHHPRGLTYAIAGALGVRSCKGGARDGMYQTRFERVIEALKHSSRFLLIDEAHALQDSAVELLRDLHDTCQIPILCLATKDFHDRLVKNAEPDHGQIYSRFDVMHSLTEGYDMYAGGKALYTMEDVRQLYNEPPVKLSADGVRFLHEVANMLGYGSLRRCKTLLQNGARRARKRQGLEQGDKVTVTADDLAYVERLLRRESSEQQTVTDRRRQAAALSAG